MWMPLFALLLMQSVPGAAPGPEAEVLGKRLAETGSLAALLPAMIEEDREELIAEYPDWSDADKDALRATLEAIAAERMGRLMAAMGHGYAERLSLEDLRALVAFNESPAAQHWRAATPEATIAAMTAIGDIDLKGEARKAFCAKTGKACAK